MIDFIWRLLGSLYQIVELPKNMGINAIKGLVFH